MSNFLNFIEHPVLAKGLNPDNVIISNHLLNHLFEEELVNLKKLKNLPKITLPANNPVLLYPGSGSDILYPLFFLDLFNNIKQITMIFIDKKNHLGMIKSILNNLGISFAENKFAGDKDAISFYWNQSLVELTFLAADIFNFDFPAFDIYFERKLAIFKDRHEYYETNIFNKLTTGGLLISDYGFSKFKLNPKLDRISVPLELSLYGEMVVGIKEEKF